MSLTSALNSAMSGLAAASRGSQIVSDNIANATTPGYGRRSLETASDSIIGSGVRVIGVSRDSDPGVIASRRTADADHAMAKSLAEFFARAETLVGSATDEWSLTARVSAFETSLISAASAPESSIRLDEVAQRAADLVETISNASEGVQEAREDSDSSIADLVDRLNDRLAQVKQVNVQITASGAKGTSTAALLDQRQVLIDDINEIVPVNVVARNHGQIALFSDGGAILLDGGFADIGFSASTSITAASSQAEGTLSGLEVNGMALKSEALGGGLLGAQFRIRDELGPDLQNSIDEFAKNLIEQFETLDPTTNLGDPGLFTDDGAMLDTSAATGLAGRLSLNHLVDPNDAAQTWRLRDGLGADAPGDVGNSRLLQAFHESMTGVVGTSASGTSISSHATDIVASIAAETDAASQDLSFAASSLAELERSEQEHGVDTDAELQTLMIVERAYAANARIIQAVQDMFDTLTRI